MRYIYLLLILILPKVSIAQITETRPPVSSFSSVPASPETASMVKYGDIPVSYYTGVANISVPLHELQSREIKVPIGLSYHASGIKVEELATAAGLGWNLSVGGSISRVVRGMPDWENNGYSGNAPLVKHSLNPVWDGTEEQNKDYMYALEVAKGEVDAQPDLYYFSFPGRSGQFAFDQSGVGHTIPFQKLKIEYLNASEVEGLSVQSMQPVFVITDEQGWQYLFEEGEGTTTYADQENCPDAGGFYQMPLAVHETTAWHLKLIKTPKGDEIKFFYRAQGLSYHTSNMESSTTLRDNQYGCSEVSPSYTSCQNRVVVTGSLIDSISTSVGSSVKFEYDEGERADVAEGNRLKSVHVMSAEKLVKSFDFYHSYFDAGSSAPSYAAEARYRLRLDSLQETGLPPYVFEYNNEKQLPHRLSFGQDMWGYANGADGGNTLLPTVTLGGKTLQGNARSINPAYLQAAMLQKITYPTKGFSTFEYEPNDYYFVGTNVTYADSAKAVVSSVEEISEEDFTITANSQQIRLRYANTGGTTITGSVSMKVIGENGYELNLQGSSSAEGDAVVLQQGKYRLSIGPKPDSTVDAYLSVLWVEKHETQVKENQLGGGLRVKKISDFDGQPESEVKVRHFSYNRPTAPEQSSGLTVAKPLYGFINTIVTTQSGDSEVNYLTCEYIKRASQSSASLSSIQGGVSAYEYVTVSYGTAGEEGKIVYKYSKEEDKGAQMGFPFPPPISYDWLRGQLLEETSYTYDNVEKKYVPVRHQVNTYNVLHNPVQVFDYINGSRANESNINGLKIVITKPEAYSSCNTDGGDGCMSYHPAEFAIAYFKYVSAWSYLSSTVDSLFDVSGSRLISVTKSNFHYSNVAHAQVTHTNTETSDGKILAVQNLYPLDYTIDPVVTADSYTTAIKMMQQQHIISPVLEQQSWIKVKGDADSLVTASELNLYNGLNREKKLYANLQRPVSDFSPSGIINGNFKFDETHYEPYMIFEKYDGNGNILQLQKAEDTPMSYIWGYNNSLPIAQIQNASHAQVFHTSFEETGTEAAGAKTGRRFHTGNYAFAPPAGFTPVAGSTLSYWRWTASTGKWTLVEQLYNSGSVTCTGDRVDEIRITPPNAIMTTYTYDSLVGMTSVTDANGKTQYYNYDNFGRLMHVRDQDGNILQQHEYIYRR